jgi:hypothetical protein
MFSAQNTNFNLPLLSFIAIGKRMYRHDMSRVVGREKIANGSSVGLVVQFYPFLNFSLQRVSFTEQTNQPSVKC